MSNIELDIKGEKYMKTLSEKEELLRYITQTKCSSSHRGNILAMP